MKIFGITVTDTTHRSHIGSLSVSSIIALMLVGDVCVQTFLVVVLGIQATIPDPMWRLAEAAAFFYLGRGSTKQDKPEEQPKQGEAKPTS
jgi:hypothetical protein